MINAASLSLITISQFSLWRFFNFFYHDFFLEMADLFFSFLNLPLRLNIISYLY